MTATERVDGCKGATFLLSPFLHKNMQEPQSILFAFAFLVLLHSAFSQDMAPTTYYPEYCGRDPSQGFGPIPSPKFASKHSDPLTLVLVQTIIRHGDRAPVIGYPCWQGEGPWNCTLFSQERPGYDSEPAPRLYSKKYLKGQNIHPGNCATGQLTQKGYEQEKTNGKTFRSYYIDSLKFLPPKLNSSLIYVHADDVPRVFTSAEALLLGLYPPNCSQNLIEEIDIWTEDFTNEQMYGNTFLCPRLQQYLDQFFASKAWQEHFSSTTWPLMVQLGAILGKNASDIVLGDMFDCFQASMCHLLPLPSGVTFDLYKRVIHDVEYMFQQMYNFPNRIDFCRVNVGFLLAEIFNRFQLAVARRTPLKFLLYSGHDTTLMPILSGFGVWDGKWAPYASYIIFELYRQGSDHYVRMVWNSKEMTIPQCGGPMCPYAKFVSVMKQLIITDPKAQCSVTDN